MSEDEKIVRESIIHGKAWCIETEAAFDRLMTIAPHGETWDMEKLAKFIFTTYRQDLIDDEKSISALTWLLNGASRTATGDGALRKTLEAIQLEASNQDMDHRAFRILTIEVVRDALAAAPTHDAVSVPDGWIKTTDHLPEKPNNARYEHVDCLCWDTADYDDYFCDPTEQTHWMPRPEAPKSLIVEKKA